MENNTDEYPEVNEQLIQDVSQVSVPVLKVTRAAGELENKRTALRAAVLVTSRAQETSVCCVTNYIGISSEEDIQYTVAHMSERPYKASYFLSRRLEGNQCSP